MKTTQEIFNHVVTFLRAQGVRAYVEPDGCRYRTPDSLKCAVGCLIADEHYTPGIENHTVYDFEVIDALQASGIPVESDEVMRLLHELQMIHDDMDPLDWDHSWAALALKFTLAMPAP